MPTCHICGYGSIIEREFKNISKFKDVCKKCEFRGDKE